MTIKEFSEMSDSGKDIIINNITDTWIKDVMILRFKNNMTWWSVAIKLHTTIDSCRSAVYRRLKKLDIPATK